MKLKFRDIRLSKQNKERLHVINSIVEDYQAQGYRLTLRQLYYQLVSRDIVPNKASEYGKLSNLLKEGRMSGQVDWDAIEDRLRKPSSPSSWESPKDIMKSAISSFALPRLAGQANYIETWVEKDALSGVLKRVTEPYHVPIMVNRGYSSVSAMYDAYLRFSSALLTGQKVTILYLGDFDPSGMDMIRDVKDRILEFILNDSELMEVAEKMVGFGESHPTEEQDALHTEMYDTYKYDERALPFIQLTTEDDYKYVNTAKAYLYSCFEVIPIALTRDQINQYDPPPNPAKTTDPRSGKFISEEGDTSWEVDALKPEVLANILESHILDLLDLEKYKAVVAQEKAHKAKLTSMMNTL